MTLLSTTSASIGQLAWHTRQNVALVEAVVAVAVVTDAVDADPAVRDPLDRFRTFIN